MLEHAKNLVKVLPAVLLLAVTVIPGSSAQASEGYFCDSYDECRGLFHTAAEMAAADISGAKVWAVPLDHVGDDNLFIDAAFYPAPTTGEKKLLILSSGIHGLEGYTGSAIQRLFTRELLPDAQKQGIDVLMMHGINAFGMKHTA